MTDPTPSRQRSEQAPPPERPDGAPTSDLSAPGGEPTVELPVRGGSPAAEVPVSDGEPSAELPVAEAADGGGPAPSNTAEPLGSAAGSTTGSAVGSATDDDDEIVPLAPPDPPAAPGAFGAAAASADPGTSAASAASASDQTAELPVLDTEGSDPAVLGGVGARGDIDAAVRAGDPPPVSSDGMLVLGSPVTPPPAPKPANAPPAGPPCTECGGTFGPDGYCERCGSARPNPRHHFELKAPIAEPGGPPTTVWVAGVCDRGVRHRTNEDSLALHAEPGSPRRAAMVVCDGVSTARRSARASQEAARAALGVLSASHSRGLAGVASAHVGALGGRLDAATDAAMSAVIEVAAGPDTPEDTEESGIPHVSEPACTFVAAVIDDDVAVVGSVGDSRGYWFPDSGEPQLLTTDDSWAEEQIALGASRREAEASPHAHTITRWLGPEAPDHTPRKATVPLSEPGWLMVCSDGLWNYASAPEQLGAVLTQIVPTLPRPTAPLALARRLVEWANAQGGRDNITIALARIDDPAAAETEVLDTEVAGAGEAGETSRDTAPGSAPTEQLTTAASPAGPSGGATAAPRPDGPDDTDDTEDPKDMKDQEGAR